MEQSIYLKTLNKIKDIHLNKETKYYLQGYIDFAFSKTLITETEWKELIKKIELSQNELQKIKFDP